MSLLGKLEDDVPFLLSTWPGKAAESPIFGSQNPLVVLAGGNLIGQQDFIVRP